MASEVMKGIGVGLVMIVIVAIIGSAIGFACSGGDYEVAGPEEAERVGQLEVIEPTDLA